MFNDAGFGTFQPGAASARARAVANSFVPGAGIQGRGLVPQVPVVGLLIIVGALLLLEHGRRRLI